MIIDLHVHTSRYSPCSELEPEAAVGRAIAQGLDGICFVEHNKLWAEKEINDLRENTGFRVFSAMEVESRQGHMLIFGVKEVLPQFASAGRLYELVRAAGGFMVAAHPFRGFLTFGPNDLLITAERASARPEFLVVDALETMSGKATQEENELAGKVAGILGIPGAGGSDAHGLADIGRCVTLFEGFFDEEDGLLMALRGGKFCGISR